MTTPQFAGPDRARSRLRATMAALEREIRRLPGPGTEQGRDSPDALHAAFADLVAELALGPEPDVRECPVCQHVVMRAARRCGYCWNVLTPTT